jgi:hypothetical protein
MVLKVIENKGDSPMYVMGRMIGPGCAEMVDVPPNAEDEVPTQGDAEPENPLAVLLAGPLKEVVPALDGLSDEDLAAVEALEVAGKNRKGVLEAVLELKLVRAGVQKGELSGAGEEGEA